MAGNSGASQVLSDAIPLCSSFGGQKEMRCNQLTLPSSGGVTDLQRNRSQRGDTKSTYVCELAAQMTSAMTMRNTKQRIVSISMTFTNTSCLPAFITTHHTH
ncbi:hypothetical protein CRM22_009963 [Opisthorchis felineus]|uniref:Uncharacterized protein n=1 Tax=Opisthorchis felineus TaxID=147828 RepID=A0A4S2L4Q2_OPIFE|nr:hypothetical protein CRM22_009963 [Opisthorchis felineus]